jgi:hypothetical protein
MNAPSKKKVEPKRKLVLHRETLRTLAAPELAALDGVVGGTETRPQSVYPYCWEPTDVCA